MTTKAVIDLGFGDGGKGTFTAYLCSISDYPLVVRFSGGHQAGHTVVHEGIRHIFSSFGSGTLQNVPTYWSSNCTFYPTAFLNELHVLKEKGINPRIYIDKKCPVTTFCDVVHNRRVESKTKHGSCGVGFGATLEREEKYYSLLAEDLLHTSVLKIKLEQIMKYYNIPDSHKEKELFLKDCKEVLDAVIIKDVMFSGHDVIYEGSQGLLLDKDIGFFPHVTRANVGSKAIDGNIDELFYVTRAYQTRHGNGPMTNEHRNHNIKKNPNETNVTNYQGEFRRTLLDLDLLEYAIQKDYDPSQTKKVSLVITCLDHVENEWRFTHNGRIVHSLDENEFVEKILDILGMDDVYLSKSEKYTNIEQKHPHAWGRRM